MTTTTIEQVDELGRRWVAAERAGDVTALDAMSTADFTLVGPLGFVLDKSQWLDRYRSGDLVTHTLAWEQAGGDLVLLHAIGVHGLVLLAVPAVLLARTATSPTGRLRVVALAVTALVGGLALLAGHAFAQVPWNELGAPAVVALALCAAVLLGAYGAVAHALYRTPTRRHAGG